MTKPHILKRGSQGKVDMADHHFIERKNQSDAYCRAVQVLRDLAKSAEVEIPSAGTFDPETATLIEWFLTTSPPAEPFDIHQGVTILRPEVRAVLRQSEALGLNDRSRAPTPPPPKSPAMRDADAGGYWAGIRRDDWSRS